jgi:DNA-binding NarL/FixJ family response regulator
MTRRESEVLNIMATGASNQEIAEKLSVNIQTVKSHVCSNLRKLHATSRYQASEMGIKQGLVIRPKL